MQQLVKIIEALSDVNRLKIIKLLQKNPLCVCEIEKLLPISQSTTSHHLKILTYTNIVTSEKQGTWIIYQLNTANLSAEIQEIVQAVLNCLDKNKVCETLLKEQKKLSKIIRGNNNTCKNL